MQNPQNQINVKEIYLNSRGDFCKSVASILLKSLKLTPALTALYPTG